tara:strand:+ start:359 stop:685 length:327 start_codon:yes stop_codon:yes gene_type:complete
VKVLEKATQAKYLLMSIVCLCFLDATFTVIWIEAGIAEEANPIMRIFISRSYLLFMAVKLAVTFGGVLILRKYKEKRMTINAATFLNLVYIYIILYHVVGFTRHITGI